MSPRARRHRQRAGRTNLTRLALALGVLLVLAGVLWRKPIETYGKTLLLLSEALPQIPLKPLHFLTSEPVHEQIELEAAHGKIVADLFLPTPRFGSPRPNSSAAIILAMGVKTHPKDRPLLLDFARTLSRLGYVVLWPRLEVLDEGQSLPEDPETFVVAFHYLRELDLVAKDRVSVLGFSVGSSVGFVAAADQRIADDVRALIFFGGYYDIFDYLVSLATHTSSFHGQEIAWSPVDDAVGHATEILEAKDADGIARLFSASTREEAEAVLRSAPANEVAELRKLSPSSHLETFRASIFILHDQGDRYVPYLESAKLDQALTSRVEKTYLLLDFFEHVQPKEGISLDALRESIRLYGFVYEVLGHL